MKYIEEATEEEILKKSKEKEKDEFRFKSDFKGDIMIIAKMKKDYQKDSKIGNLTRVLQFIHKIGRNKTVRIKNTGFNNIEIYCKDIYTANHILSTKNSQIMFIVPEGKKRCKGVIEWDKDSSLQEFYEAVTQKEEISSMERITSYKKDTYNKEGKKILSNRIIVTWEGSYLPSDIGMWDDLVRIKVKPYIEPVIQCHNCYNFGHWKTSCNAKKKCSICGDNYHGDNCHKDIKCGNCGGPHRSTNKKCPYYIFNYEVKKKNGME